MSGTANLSGSETPGLRSNQALELGGRQGAEQVQFSRNMNHPTNVLVLDDVIKKKACNLVILMLLRRQQVVLFLLQ